MKKFTREEKNFLAIELQSRQSKWLFWSIVWTILFFPVGLCMIFKYLKYDELILNINENHLITKEKEVILVKEILDIKKLREK